MHITFPTFLTLIRLIISPTMLPLLLVYGLVQNNFLINIALACFFVLLCLTDYFDGSLARRWNQVSALGKSLDPLADKFLVYSTLIALLAANKIYFYWVVILIGRDFFMMGLRQIALEHNFSVDVSWFGKIKTAVLMSYLTCVILNPYHDQWQEHIVWNSVETILLITTLVLSIWSAKKYYHVFMSMMKSKIEY